MTTEKKNFGSTAPDWTAENQADLWAWIKANTATAPDHLQEFQALRDAYNVDRVLRGWSVLSNRAVAGMLKNLGFQFWRLSPSRRQGIVGLKLTGA